MVKTGSLYELPDHFVIYDSQETPRKRIGELPNFSPFLLIDRKILFTQPNDDRFPATPAIWSNFILYKDFLGYIFDFNWTLDDDFIPLSSEECYIMATFVFHKKKCEISSFNKEIREHTRITNVLCYGGLLGRNCLIQDGRGNQMNTLDKITSKTPLPIELFEKP
jgi:hypothetical protein